jgi:hypothetical protein
MNLPDWKDTGLPDEMMFKVERSMPYWQQFPPELFLQSIFIEVGQRVNSVSSLVKAVVNDPAVASTPMELLNGKTAGETGELISRLLNETLDILDIIREYALLPHSKNPPLQR